MANLLKMRAKKTWFLALHCFPLLSVGGAESSLGERQLHRAPGNPEHPPSLSLHFHCALRFPFPSSLTCTERSPGQPTAFCDDPGPHPRWVLKDTCLSLSLSLSAKALQAAGGKCSLHVARKSDQTAARSPAKLHLAL